MNRTIKIVLPPIDVIQTQANESINLKRRLINSYYTGKRISLLHGDLRRIRVTTTNKKPRHQYAAVQFNSVESTP